MTADVRTFILQTEAHAGALWAFLRNNWQALAEQGNPLQVRVSQYRKNRSNEQNALMWAWLAEIEEQAIIRGRSYSADVWNWHMKEHLLPEETASGKKKWHLMPDGSRRLVLSTSDLNVEEMGEYLDKMAAYAATDLGVILECR